MTHGIIVHNNINNSHFENRFNLNHVVYYYYCMHITKYISIDTFVQCGQNGL